MQNINLESVKFIREHGLNCAIEKFKLISKRHNKYPNLVLLKYNQIESPMGERVCQECRALILDENQDWMPVSYPYDKFWNYGEGYAQEIDWKTARVLEKLDGSLLVMYYFNGEWNVSTSGTPDGEALTLAGQSFANLFWRVWESLGYKLPDDINCCFMFELMTPLNRVVVRHKSNRIVLHGVRNMQTLEERNPENFASKYGWECVHSFPLNTMSDVINACRDVDPMEFEGYVVLDANFHRIKVKSPQYIALHHLKDSLGNGVVAPRRMLEIIRINENKEFLNYFPEYQNLHDKVKDRYDALCLKIMESFENHKNEVAQKDFALKVKDLPYAFACFSLRKNPNITVKEILLNTNIDYLSSLLNLNNINVMETHFGTT